MNKGKVLVIGPVGSGKSTLTKRLLGKEDVPVKKTQSLEYTNWIIDSPGEYSQNPMYYRTLMATALEAKGFINCSRCYTKGLCFTPELCIWISS